ncbi:MAG: hypothetical protein M0Q90_08985 [Bacteroidales bacterium]|nr:hypothetical protein [Bacteroidales bacterium]
MKSKLAILAFKSNTQIQKQTIILTILLLVASFVRGQNTDRFIIKTSVVELLGGDFVTRSWSPNLIIEKPLSNNYSFQQGIGLILPDNNLDKEMVFIFVDRVFGITIRPELKKYISKNKDVLNGFYLSIDAKGVYTEATLTVRKTIVNRFDVATHLNFGYQVLSKSNFLIELSAGIGPGYIYSTSSVEREDLGLIQYRRGILYAGGSGAYLSYQFDIRIGYHLKLKR